MKLKLIRLNEQYRSEFEEMMEEWITFNDTHDTNHSPSAIFKNDYHDFANYVSNLDDKADSLKGLVDGSTYFAYDEEIHKMVGAVNIRHALNEYLLKYGGHIGDGVRPSFRKKGYATAMIHLSLEKCRELGIRKVLICCNQNNIGSAKSIMNNGGVLENEITDPDGEVMQRYWIAL